jgi:hypothetical protein
MADNENVGISLQDIAAAVQIIDAATQRGAIRGDELVSVGTIRDRFVKFLDHAQKQDVAAQTEAEAQEA